MPVTTQFYRGDQDYIAKLNGLAVEVNAAVGEAQHAAANAEAAQEAADQYLRDAISSATAAEGSAAAAEISATRSASVGAATSALAITKTGDYRFPPAFLLTPPRNLDVSGSWSSGAGKWVESVSYGEQNTAVGPQITSLSFDDLVGTVGNYGPNNMAALTTLSTPALAYVGGIYYPNHMAALTTLSTPALAYVGGSYYPNYMAALTTLSTPALAYVGGAYCPNKMAALTTLSTPALAYVGSTYCPRYMAALTTLSLPAIVNIGGRIEIDIDTPAISSLTLGPTLKAVGGDVVVTSAALTQASVDDVLGRLAALDGTNGTTAFSSPLTVTLTGTSATPGAAGLASKAILVARGVSVTHN